MDYFISLLSGTGISFMTAINGLLGQQLGSFLSAIFIHLTGLITIIIITIITKTNFISKEKIPLFFYSGGIVGIFTLVFTVIAFNYLSITALLALGLLGQTLASLVCNKLKLFSHENDTGIMTISGLVIIFLGIFLMLRRENVKVLAVILALLSGVTIVINRIINATLSKHSSNLTGTLWNYITGFVFSIPMVFILGRKDLSLLPNLTNIPLWMFTGGIIGVFVVFISIYATPRINGVILSVLIFIGQVFTSIILDYFLIGEIQMKLIYGSLIVLGGLILISKNKKIIDDKL
ncbi:MAG: DMT family transporter [Sphaerochaetaceae bacterium]